MRGSMIRHKSRLNRFIHQAYFPAGSTLALFPALRFQRNYPENRATLASALRLWRKNHGRFIDQTHYN